MPLPLDPSSTLANMLERLRTKSYADPRPMNPLGRKAPLASYADLCQRHQFETTILPEARSKRWPTHIKFETLPGRIQAIRNTLSHYIINKESSSFWQEIMQEVGSKGARKALGIADQFNTFDKCLPG